MLAAQRRGTGPMAQIRRLGAFAGISVLAMVHQVREHCRVFLQMSLAPWWRLAGLAAERQSGQAPSTRPSASLTGIVDVERVGSARRVFTGTSADMAAAAWSSLGM